jgi:hypothetical protein
MHGTWLEAVAHRSAQKWVTVRGATQAGWPPTLRLAFILLVIQAPGIVGALWLLLRR